MELREYGQILRRRWWLLLLLPLLAAVATILTYQEPPVTFGYSLQYSVSFMPLTPEGTDQDPRLNAVQASEYVADDLTAILQGTEFAGFVRQYLPGEQPVGRIASATRVTRLHRIVTISLEADAGEQATQLAEAVKQATENDLQAFVDGLFGTGELRLSLVDEEGPTLLSGGLRSRLDIPLRVALALVAAVALAFALDYLDDSIRSRAEAEKLVGRVLGEIPQ